jgi:hypothetical protein
MFTSQYYGWSTHRPLLKSLIDVFKPYFIMELGIGTYSTPILYNPSWNYIGIEQDSGWIDKITEDFNYPRNIFIHHQQDSDIALRYSDMPDELKISLKQYYSELSNIYSGKYPIVEGFKMLFVDNYTGSRTIAINTMYDDFDIIAFHDSEPEFIDVYEYYFCKEIYDNYDLYTLHTDICWTSVFIKKSLKDLSQELPENINKYIKEWGEEKNIFIKNIELKKENNLVRYLTKPVYIDKINRINNDYWRNSAEQRWSYMSFVINEIIKLNPNTSLELGVFGLSLMTFSDTMEMELDNVDIDNRSNKIYLGDCRCAIKEIPDKKYDVFVGLQVLEHLTPNQNEFFNEIKRISRYAIISLPFRWNCPDDKEHNNIDEQVIIKWTDNKVPYKNSVIENRIILCYDFTNSEQK